MSELLDRPWFVIGAGRLGGLIALMAAEAGISDLRVWSRSKPLAAARFGVSGTLEEVLATTTDAVVWLTVVDSALAETASKLAGSSASPRLVLHGSGSLSSELLVNQGLACSTGSLHPLLSISRPEAALEKVGTVRWTYEGDPAGLELAQHLLAKFGNAPAVIEPSKKMLYHAAAVAASGLVTATVDVALSIASEAGFSAEEAREMLVPLTKSTVANLLAQTPRDALTGPVARRDVSTVRAHMKALETLDDADVIAIYRLLSRRLADSEFAQAAGLDDST